MKVTEVWGTYSRRALGLTLLKTVTLVHRLEKGNQNGQTFHRHTALLLPSWLGCRRGNVHRGRDHRHCHCRDRGRDRKR